MIEWVRLNVVAAHKRGARHDAEDLLINGPGPYPSAEWPSLRNELTGHGPHVITNIRVTDVTTRPGRIEIGYEVLASKPVKHE